MSFELPKLLWLASPNISERTAKVDLIVIHDCQGSYQGSISAFQDPDNGGRPVSAHVVLKEDGSEATQMVAWDKKAWHAVAFNSRSIGLEMAGFESKGYSDDEWNAEAAMTACLCHGFGIPVRWAEKGQGPGITRHLDLGAAGGGHTDPTEDPKVWQSFIDKVHAAYDGMALPLAPWGKGWPSVVPVVATPTPVVPAPVRIRAKGVTIPWVQGMLNRVETEHPPLAVDGQFGPRTKARLSEFLRGEEVDPFIDYITTTAVTALKAAFAKL